MYTDISYLNIQYLAKQLRRKFYQSRVSALQDRSPREWWKHIKSLMGQSVQRHSELQGLANELSDGNMEALAESINQFMVSVNEELPRLEGSHPIFHETGPLPADLTITVEEMERAPTSLKVNQATGPDNIPAWVLRDFAHVLAKPLAAIFNSSLREGILPSAWKSVDVIPLPKRRPPASLESDLRPISLTAIPVKVLESILVKRINKGLEGKVDEKQFGSIAGCSTTDALVELTHKWFEATDTAGTYVRIVLVD